MTAASSTSCLIWLDRQGAWITRSTGIGHYSHLHHPPPGPIIATSTVPDRFHPSIHHTRSCMRWATRTVQHEIGWMDGYPYLDLCKVGYETLYSVTNLPDFPYETGEHNNWYCGFSIHSCQIHSDAGSNLKVFVTILWICNSSGCVFF